MRLTIMLSILFACSSAPAQNPAMIRSEVPKLEELNAVQQRAVEEYIEQNERLTGEVKWIADRHLMVFSSDALRTLFPRFRFVATRWITEADQTAFHKYSIPGPILKTLVLDEDGRNCMPKHTGYREEFGELLRTEHVKINDARSAAVVRSAFAEIYAGGGADDLRTTDLRHENLHWLLGYHEEPFRAISGYEEIREAYYYLISVNSEGFVVSGRSVTKVLERRKLDSDKTPD